MKWTLLLLILMASVAFAAEPTKILIAEPLIGFQQDGCKAVLSFRFEMDNGWQAGPTFEEDNQTYRLSVLMLDSQVQGRWEACGEYEEGCVPGIEPVIYNPQDFKAGWYQAKLSLLKVGQVNEVLDSTYLSFDLRDMPACNAPVERIETETEKSDKATISGVERAPWDEPKPSQSRELNPTAIALLVVFLALVASTALFLKFSR